MELVQQKAVLFGTWWYWVSRRRYRLIHDGTGSVCGSTCWYWLIYDGTGSVWGDNGWFLVILGQYGAALFGSWLYWVSMGRYWLVLGGTGSEEGNNG